MGLSLWNLVDFGPPAAAVKLFRSLVQLACADDGGCCTSKEVRIEAKTLLMPTAQPVHTCATFALPPHHLFVIHHPSPVSEIDPQVALFAAKSSIASSCRCELISLRVSASALASSPKEQLTQLLRPPTIPRQVVDLRLKAAAKNFLTGSSR